MTMEFEMTHAPAEATLPRIDRFVVHKGQVKCLSGIPTKGATFENLWGVQALPEGAIPCDPEYVLVGPGTGFNTTVVEIPPAWQTEVQPSNAKVYRVRDLMRQANEPGIANRNQSFHLHALYTVIEYVATMSHADVLTAQRMAKEALR